MIRNHSKHTSDLYYLKYSKKKKRLFEINYSDFNLALLILRKYCFHLKQVGMEVTCLTAYVS